MIVLAPLFFLLASGGRGSGVALLVVIVTLPATIYLSLGLQARRLRDMGWPPFPVLAGWIAFMLIDALFAHLVPGIAGGRHGTMLGSLVNIGLGAALLFWPSAPDDTDRADIVPPSPPRYVPTTRQRALPGEQVAAAAPGGSRPAGFGRRTA